MIQTVKHFNSSQKRGAIGTAVAADFEFVFSSHLLWKICHWADEGSLTLFLCQVFFFFLAEFYGFINTNTMCTQAVYSFSSLWHWDWWLVTLMAGWAAVCTTALWFFEETSWAASAQWDLAHICSTSSSLTPRTRSFWKPLGSTHFVFPLLS